MPKYDVIIVGFGPTGSVLAYLLGMQGVSTLVLEENSVVVDFPRAVHLDGETMRIFQFLNLHRQVQACSHSDMSISFLNANNQLLHYQDFKTVDQVNGWPNDFLFWQPTLDTAIRERVSALDNVDIRLGWVMKAKKTSEKFVVVEISNGNKSEAISCDFLLGCDGAKSLTRKLANISQIDLGCEEPWLVCDLIFDKKIEIDKRCYQICDPVRPVTIVPCHANHIRWEFMLDKSDELTSIANENSVRTLMAPHMKRLNPDLKPSDGTIIRASIYNFHSLIANDFRNGRVFLLGDAAHQMPPFLGQGMCAGIRDAFNLSWKLGGVIRGNWDHRVLDSYHSERKTHVEQVIRKVIKIGGVLQTRNRLAAVARDFMLWLGHIFPSLVSNLNFVSGWRLGDGIFYDKSEALSRYLLRQPTITLPSGELVKLDSLLGKGFSIIGFNIDPAPLVQAEDTKFLVDGFKTVEIGESGDGIDVQGVLTAWAKKQNIALAMLRPDRHIYGVCYFNKATTYQEQLPKLFLKLRGQLC